ncbi:hypothetical protein C0J52_22968 [Blattella germanica]|nr:hypothetical protein C0J52_22968 [Blattella germanica]
MVDGVGTSEESSSVWVMKTRLHLPCPLDKKSNVKVNMSPRQRVHSFEDFKSSKMWSGQWITVLRDQPGNVIISPVSVYTLLAILQQGASGNSSQELNTVLHAQPQETKEAYRNLTTKYQEPVPLTTLEFATKAFVRSGYNVKEEFQQNLMHNFNSSAESLNFNDTTASSEHINSWVSEGSIPADSLLVLVNTIYFNSFWDHPFYGNVQNKSFSPHSGKVVYVPTLYQEEFYPGGECSHLGAKYVHINFEHSDDFSVLLVLPNERHGLDNLMNHLTAENLTSLFPYGAYKKVKLQWPKFRLNTDTQLIPVLQKPASAHFVPNAENMEFTADHPFLFFIVDRKNSVPLFAGRVIAQPDSLDHIIGGEEMTFTADHLILFFIIDKILPFAVLENNAGNAVISPVSVYTLLAIVQQGAVGTTRTEVDNVVHAQPENTRLSDITPNTALVLVNALYFKSFWNNPFGSAENMTFSPSNGVEIQVPTLSQTEVYHAGECSCIGIKYVHLEFIGTNDFTVMLVLPTERHGLATLLEQITPQNLTNIISHTGLKRVTLQLPKFRLASASQLVPLLQKLGMNQIFQNNADLSGMTNQAIALSKVIQKAEIKLDEGGVTAAAATGFTWHYVSDVRHPNVDDMEFIADQPFLFFIVDRINHVPLFAGRVTNPSLS